MTTVAVVAVFTSKNEAGTVALIALGGGLFVLGIVGVIPVRGSFGSLAWEFALLNLLSDENPEIRVTVASEVAKAPKRLLNTKEERIVRATAEHVLSTSGRDYEEAVSSALKRIDPSGGLEREAEIAKMRPDAVIGKSSRIEDVIAVEIKLRLTSEFLRLLADRYESHGVRRLLIVTAGEIGLHQGMALYISRHSKLKLEVVRWESEDDDDKIRQAIERLQA